jgi:hypothetical protein
MKRWIAAAAAAALLAGCGQSGERNEGGLTASDNEGLNNAADMLDTTPDNLVPVENGTLDNGDSGAMDAVDAEQDASNAAASTNIH